MEIRFITREDGQVDVNLGPDWEVFTEALNDCVSSLPPRGAASNGPSPYWVDVARAGLEQARATHSDRPFAGGNFTCLRLNGGQIEARYDFDDEDQPGQFLDVDVFQSVLDDWRVRIERSSSISSVPLPETYRRNPLRTT